MKNLQHALRLAAASSIVGMASATIVVSEPFDYNVGSHAQGGDNKWSASMGVGSGTGWEDIWFGHTSGLTFGISSGGHTGTFADAAGTNATSNNWRSRYMSPSVHQGGDGDVIWQYLTVSITGTGTEGQLATETRSGYGQFAVRVLADGTYTLAAQHGFGLTDASAINASQDETAPDVILVKFENQVDAGSDLVDIKMWVNPTALTEGELPDPDMELLNVTPSSGRSIGGITWKPGTMQIDNFKLATAYTDLGIGVVVEGPIISVKSGVTTLTDGVSTVAMGSSVTGIPVNRVLTIVNDGESTLNIGAITIDGDNASEFSVGTPGDTTLEPDEITTVTVTYTPTQYGAVVGTLHIASDSEGDLASFDLNLTGTGLPPISVSQSGTAVIDGGSVSIMGLIDDSVSRTFTITNKGLDTLTLGSITLDGADAANFSVGALGDTSLETDESTTFTVTFTSADDLAKTAAIHIDNSAAGDVDPFDITLVGTAHIFGSTIVVTEPFNYAPGLHAAGSSWPSMGINSGIGWGDNQWFGHTATVNFNISTGGHTGTFADSTGMNLLTNEWRQRNMSPAVHSSDDGDIIWQHLTMSRSGTGTAGQLTTENSGGGMHYAVQIGGDGFYSLRTGQRNITTVTSTVQASTDPTEPDVIIVKMVNQVDDTSNLFDVYMWINPGVTAEDDLPAPDLQVLGVAPYSGVRNIGSINWKAGNTQIDNFILAADYADLFFVPETPIYADWAVDNAGGQEADEDFDGDGVSNGVEYFMGETGSTFTANPQIEEDGAVVWSMNPTFQGTYEVQFSTDLENWEPIPEEALLDFGNALLCDVTLLTPEDGKVFVRLLVSPTMPE
jgi:hypothetical protein